MNVMKWYAEKDPDSRVFLSTDAGGVGLNLRSAAYLINLDIPWNPAVLEQRIARIYRIGQKKKVNIINLVTIDSIEHRMLDVLKFKSSMAEGVLDAWDDTILMQEDRFQQFMNSVESMVDGKETFETALESDPEESGNSEDLYHPEPTTEKSSTENQQLDLFDTDVPEPSDSVKSEPITQTQDGQVPEWVSQLAQVFSDPQKTKSMVNSFIDKDVSTGKTYLKLPVENGKVVENVLMGIGQLFLGNRLEQGGKIRLPICIHTGEK